MTKYKCNLTHPVVSTRLPRSTVRRFDQLLKKLGKSRACVLGNYIECLLRIYHA